MEGVDAADTQSDELKVSEIEVTQVVLQAGDEVEDGVEKGVADEGFHGVR